MTDTDTTPDELESGKPTKAYAAEASQVSPISADWVARTQYEMAERVEGRVVDWLKSRVAPFGAILAILAFLGAPLILDYVTHKIENDLTKNTEILRQRVEVELADMETRTAQLKSQADAAQSELTKLKEFANEVENISPQYNALKSQVDQDRTRVNDLEKQLREKVEETSQTSEQLKQVKFRIQGINQQVGDLTTNMMGTQQLALSTQVGIANLGSAFTRRDAVGALITASGSPFFSRDISLTGQNFGSSKGKLYLQVSNTPFFVTQNLTSIEVGDESLVSWNDSSITLHLSDALMQKVEQARLQGSPEGATLTGLANSPFANSLYTYYQFSVQTSAGQTSNWWSLEGPPPGPR